MVGFLHSKTRGVVLALVMLTLVSGRPLQGNTDSKDMGLDVEVSLDQGRVEGEHVSLGRHLTQCSSCDTSPNNDGGALCESKGLQNLANVQADLLLSCPLSLFPMGMDSCCGALLKYDWAVIESCLCSGKTGLAGLIVSSTNIVEACGCRVNDRSINAPVGDTGSSVVAVGSPPGIAAAAATSYLDGQFS
jgi:hypothetical protein